MSNGSIEKQYSNFVLGFMKAGRDPKNAHDYSLEDTRMNKTDVSRRKFLGQTGSLALALPLAAVPASAAMTSTQTNALSAQAPMPRTLPVRQRGTTIKDASNYNLPVDGISDCSAAINAAIADLPADGGTVYIPFAATAGNSKLCIYKIDTTANTIWDGSQSLLFGIQLRSNMLLELEPGVQLMALPNNVNRAFVLLGLDVNNVEVAYGSIIGERYTHTSSGTGTDEWGHGIELLGVNAVTIRDIGISNCEGDGIAMGASSTNPSATDVVIASVVCTGNRRQGMSITNASSISVYDSEFSYTYGTAPQDGIDIVPNGTGTASNIVIVNCLFRGNAATGVGMTSGHGSTISNVNVTNCVMCFNGSSGFYSSQGGTGVTDTGTLYGNAIYQNKWKGIYLDGATKNYTVGGSSASDPLNNSFANNQISLGIVYPNPNERSQIGYSGVPRDITLSTTAQQPASNNLINWNNFYSQ
jgi:hypothetical protein